jgi:hypothetical protein
VGPSPETGTFFPAKGGILAPVLYGLLFPCPMIARSDENMQIDVALSDFVFIFSGDLLRCCRVTRAVAAEAWTEKGFCR